jgi:hypothetical protein
MKLRTVSATYCGVLFLLATSVPVFPQGKLSEAIGDVQFQFIGQANVPGAPPTLVQSQYGYLTYVNGVSETHSIFNPGPQDQATALFTFYSDMTAERITNNGPIRIIDRLGTMTIYLDTTPDGDFANPDSFRDGAPIQTSELRLQIILDTITGAFYLTSVHTITSSDFFSLGFDNFLLGKAGQKFRRTIVGHAVTPPPTSSPAAHLAGYAVGDLK